MKTTSFLSVTAAIAVLAGCATPTVVDTVKAGDASLTCDQIKVEIAEANKFEKEARGERKVTGTNVAAAVLFWPALVATYSNTEDAINAARERREKMIKLANAKRCPASVMSDDIVPAAAPTPAQTKTVGAAKPAPTPAALAFADVLQINSDRVRSCKTTGGSVVRISRAWMDNGKLVVENAAESGNADVYPMKAAPSSSQLKSLQGKLTCVVTS